jgi:hypothetical protein
MSANTGAPPPVEPDVVGVPVVPVVASVVVVAVVVASVVVVVAVVVVPDIVVVVAFVSLAVPESSGGHAVRVSASERPQADVRCDRSGIGAWSRKGRGAASAGAAARVRAGQFEGWAARSGERGSFARRDDKPVADCSAIYVPSCTGDVHAGEQPAGTVPGGPDEQAVVGYSNMDAFLRRIVPSFGEPGRVLVTEVSAGGCGAGFQLYRLARVFARSQATLLDGSGPVLRDRCLAPCLQDRRRPPWKFAVPRRTDDVGRGVRGVPLTQWSEDPIEGTRARQPACGHVRRDMSSARVRAIVARGRGGA